MPAGNFKQYYMLALVKSYLKAIYGDGDWILDFNNSQIYLNRSLIEDSQISLNEFREKIIDFIMNSAGIANAIGANQFQSIVFVEGMPVKMQNSYNQKRSGDIMISLKPGCKSKIVAKDLGWGDDPMLFDVQKIKDQFGLVFDAHDFMADHVKWTFDQVL